MTAKNGLHSIEEMLGKSFGSWTVLGFSHKREDSGNWYFDCVCKCGNTAKVPATRLRTGRSTKCKKCTGKEAGRKGLYSMSKKDLYFIRCGEYVKIGSSDNVDRRLKDLQGSNPYTVKLIYFGENEGCDEEYWHSYFKDKHHHGEWFKI